MSELASGVVHVWTIDLDRIDAAGLESVLSPEELARFARLRFPRDRARRVAARAALRLLVARYAGCDPVGLSLCETAAGKPYLEGPACGLEFNLAHTGGVALAAFALGTQVGIDVERIDPGRLDAALVRASLTADERADVERHLEPSRRFCELWTLKEAWAKAVGSGFTGSPADYPIVGRATGRPWLASGVVSLPGHASALAVATDVAPRIEQLIFAA